MFNYSGSIQVSIAQDGRIIGPPSPDPDDVICIWTTLGYKPQASEAELPEWLWAYLDDDNCLR